MRMYSTLNVTPEGSLGDMPAAIEGVEETREGTHQISGHERSPSSHVITPTEETPETHFKVATERNLTQVESPIRIQRTREASREDTITLTRHFFASVNGQNRTITTELPAGTTTDVSRGNNLNIPVTSATPIVTEAETMEAETRISRTFLPNGSPSRPIATATCRPQKWVQYISEEQINEPSQEGAGSEGGCPSEPYVLAEEIPEELGHKWRVLHPFEIPGVRFPMDNYSTKSRKISRE